MDAQQEKPKRFRRLSCFFVGLLLGAFCIVFLGIGPDALGNFTDIPSLAITGGVVVGGLLAGFGWRNLTAAWAIFLCGAAEKKEDARVTLDVCRAGIWLSIVAGFIGTLIGQINMLAQGMEDVSCLFSGIAVSLITILYSLFGIVFFVVLRERAKLALAEWEGRCRVYHAPRPQALSRRAGILYGILLPAWLVIIGILAAFVVCEIYCQLHHLGI